MTDISVRLQNAQSLLFDSVPEEALLPFSMHIAPFCMLFKRHFEYISGLRTLASAILLNYPAWRNPASAIVSGTPSPSIPTSITSAIINVESPALAVLRISHATQASATSRMGQPFEPG